MKTLRYKTLLFSDSSINFQYENCMIITPLYTKSKERKRKILTRQDVFCKKSTSCLVGYVGKDNDKFIKNKKLHR